MATYFPALDCYWCGGTHPKQQICNGMYPMQHGSREARMHGEILRLQKLLDTRSDGPNSGLTALEKKVAIFALLPDGWDSYGAKAFPKATIKLGMEMARKLGDEWKAVPCGNGSIEFYRNNEDEMVWVETTFDEEPTREQQ